MTISIDGLASNYSIRLLDIIEWETGWIIIDNDYFDQIPMTSYIHNTLPVDLPNYCLFYISMVKADSIDVTVQF